MPILQALLARNSIADGADFFVIDQLFQTIAFRESVNQPFAVFIDAPRKIACYADIERCAFEIAHDVDVSWFHDSPPVVRP